MGTAMSSTIKGTSIKSEIRVATFDLDNTIWKTGNVIGSANDALANHLDEMGIYTPTRVEKIMGQLFKGNKKKYSPVLVEDALKKDIDGENDEDGINENSNGKESDGLSREERVLEKIKIPVLLTQLRIDALIEVFSNQEDQTFTKDEIQTYANEAFDVWTKARHDAIPFNLAESVFKCLDAIQALEFPMVAKFCSSCSTQQSPISG